MDSGSRHSVRLSAQRELLPEPEARSERAPPLADKLSAIRPMMSAIRLVILIGNR
jgi:hypothetical protein